MNPYSRASGEYIHIQVADAALGHALPAGAVIHHVNGDRNNNSSTNLVICQSQKYHKLLHVRALALDACGNPDRACHSKENKAAYRKRTISQPEVAV